MSSFHQPVMVEETAEYLITRRSGIYIDLTCGGGNHLAFIAGLLDRDAVLIGVDRDQEAVNETRERLSKVPQATHIINSSYKDFDQGLERLKINRIDAAFMDLGVSSHQIDSAARGFSFLQDGPLDMRMGSDSELTAEEIVNSFPRDKLVRIFREYGEEKRASSVASAICRRREKVRITTTTDLVNTITPVLSPKYLNASLARIFQALRIFINGELDQLKETLPRLLEYLDVGGRMVVLSYHSLEDRIVKRFFQAEAKGCICPPNIPVCVCGRIPRLKILTRKVVTPREEEIASNVRARSAKLRAAEKIA